MVVVQLWYWNTTSVLDMSRFEFWLLARLCHNDGVAVVVVVAVILSSFFHRKRLKSQARTCQDYTIPCTRART